MILNSIKKQIKNYGYESFWVAFGQIGTAIGSFLSIKIITNILTPYEFGRLTLANTIVFLVTSSVYGPIGQSFMRFWSISKEMHESNNFYYLVNNSLKFASVLAIFGAMLIGLLLFIFSGLDWGILITLSIIFAASSGWISVRVSILTAARKRKIVALLHVIGIFLRLIIAAILLISLSSNSHIAMFGFLLASIIMFFFAERYFNHFTFVDSPSQFCSKYKVNIQAGFYKNIFSLSSFFFFWSMFSWIKSSADRWALQTFYGPEPVALFNVVLQLANYPIIIISGFLTSLFNPIAFEWAGNVLNDQQLKGAIKIFKKMVINYFFGISILILIFVIFHRPLVSLISNKKYIEFSFFLPAVAFALAFYELGDILGSYGVLLNNPQAYLIPKITTSLVTAISIFLFSKWLGPVGIILGLNLAGALYTPWCFIVTLRLVRSKHISFLRN